MFHQILIANIRRKVWQTVRKIHIRNSELNWFYPGWGNSLLKSTGMFIELFKVKKVGLISLGSLQHRRILDARVHIFALNRHH